VHAVILLTPWNRVFLEKVSYSAGQEPNPMFHEHKASIPHSQERNTGPYPGPDESSPQPHIQCV